MVIFFKEKKIKTEHPVHGQRSICVASALSTHTHTHDAVCRNSVAYLVQPHTVYDLPGPGTGSSNIQLSDKPTLCLGGPPIVLTNVERHLISSIPRRTKVCR